MSHHIDFEFRAERAKKLERALREKNWTRTQLASKTGYDEKTIRNLLAGHEVRDRTVFDVCQALGLEPMVEDETESVEVSDERFGGYSRSTHSNYEGQYFLYRPSFTRKGAIFKSVVSIFWHAEKSRLKFSEFYEADPSVPNGALAHNGSVYISPYTGLLHLVTVFQGSVRMLTVTKMRQADGIMRGSVTSQSEDVSFFQPTMAPIVLKKLKAYDLASLPSDIRILDEANEEVRFAKEQLSITEQRILKVCTGEAQEPRRRKDDLELPAEPLKIPSAVASQPSNGSGSLQ
jgi:DNA-binding Xre family transcriptional regulator